MNKILLIVNPHSGKKKGLQISNDVTNILKKKNLSYTTIQTTHKKHPFDIAKKIDITKYNGIFAIGGDGTMHEIINGMLSRDDGKKVPIGLIPGGTGNSFMHDLNCLNPIQATQKITNLDIRSIDIMKVTSKQETIYAYNIIGWGLPPDINILAEKIRWLGLQRYNIASLIKIIQCKKYKANISFDNKMRNNNYSLIVCSNTVHTGKGMKIAPYAKIDDGLIDLIEVKKTTRIKLFTLFSKIFSGNHIKNPIVNFNQVKNISIQPEVNGPLIIDGEILGSTPCTIKIIPKKIDIFN